MVAATDLCNGGWVQCNEIGRQLLQDVANKSLVSAAFAGEHSRRAAVKVRLARPCGKAIEY